MESRGRVVLAVLFVLAVAGCGGDEPAAEPAPPKSTGMRIELGTSDLTIYVKPAVNLPERAGGARQVQLDCVDSDGDTVMAQDEAWPFSQTDGGRYQPHTHMSLDPLTITAVERCVLRGTEPLLEAAAPG
jgi:hypothetical protein